MPGLALGRGARGAPREAALVNGEASWLELGRAWEAPSCWWGGCSRWFAEVRLWGSLLPLVAGVVAAVVGDVVEEVVVVAVGIVPAPALEEDVAWEG